MTKAEDTKHGKPNTTAQEARRIAKVVELQCARSEQRRGMEKNTMLDAVTYLLASRAVLRLGPEIRAREEAATEPSPQEQPPPR